MKTLITLLLLFPFILQAQQAQPATEAPTFDFAKASKEAYTINTPIFLEPIDRSEQGMEGLKLGAAFLTAGIAAITASFIIDRLQMNNANPSEQTIKNTAAVRIVGGLAATGGAIGMTISLSNLQRKKSSSTTNSSSIITGN